MTVLTDLKAISLTANAKGVVSAKGADLSTLVGTGQLHVIELQTVLKQIVALHPASGGDATNYAALNAVLAQLAKPLRPDQGITTRTPKDVGLISLQCFRTCDSPNPVGSVSRRHLCTPRN